MFKYITKWPWVVTTAVVVVLRWLWCCGGCGGLCYFGKVTFSARNGPSQYWLLLKNAVVPQ
jgi:hypothetical protein